MRLLLTNDDGIDAPGLLALEEAARGLGTLLVVAPAEGQSGCGHRVTTDDGVRLRSTAADRFAVKEEVEIKRRRNIRSTAEN